MNHPIELALKTWYPKDHPLHMDLKHPTMGLVGEMGEWIDLHKKDEFKSDFELTREMELDELGDIWYYLRILFYIADAKQLQSYKFDWGTDSKTLVMSRLLEYSTTIFTQFVMHKTFDTYLLTKFWEWLSTRLKQLDCDIDTLTTLNWQKLKPGSQRGDEWTKMR